MIIQSLWIGTLSTMEKICIQSFLNQGHEFHLYVYDSFVLDVPKGTIVKDAREILDPEPIKKFQRESNFANLFRYWLLYKNGGLWVDLDFYCLRHFDFNEPYVFSTQVETQEFKVTEVTNAVILAPPGAPIMKYCIDEVNRLFEQDAHIKFGATGIMLLRNAVRRFNLTQFIKSSDVFCPLSWYDAPGNINGKGTGNVVFLPGTYAVHMWNTAWKIMKCDKDGTYPEDSLYEKFKRESRR